MSLLPLAFWEGVINEVFALSVPWSLRPQNLAAAATRGRGCCELPEISRQTPKSLAASDLFAAAEAKNPVISAACEPACGHRGRCDFAMRFLCR